MEGDAPTAWLPRDVLASILVRFPASDVRRFRRVCKDWRDAISDPTFIAMHMIHHGPPTPTHTIVFYRADNRYGGAREPSNGGGFLFDEQWRLTGMFTTDGSVDMIGACQGLLCFRDRLQEAIKVVEPITGESITLPLPQMAGGPASRTCSARRYCFGFDAWTRQYKIVYSCYDSYPWSMDQELGVVTVGVDKEGRTVHVSCELHGVTYDFQPMAYGDGAVYWHTETVHGLFKYARFDLATEEITLVERRLADRRSRMPMDRITCQYPSSGSCDILIGWFGESKNGCWPHDITILPHVVSGLSCPESFLPKPHVLQRGHLLLRDIAGSLYAHKIESRETYMKTKIQLNIIGTKKLLLKIGSMEAEPAEKYKFFPVRCYGLPGREPIANDSTKVDVPIVGRLPCEGCHLSAFAYVPSLSLAPFATHRP